MEDVRLLVAARRLARSGLARSIRDGAGLSLAEMAEAMGVDPGTLSRWERGETRPRADHALRWLATLQRIDPGERRLRSLGREPVVYVAAPLAAAEDSHRLDGALEQVRERFPTARIVDGARFFRSNQEWRDRWPFMIRSLEALIVVAASDGTIGSGVSREIRDARRRQVQVEFLVDGRFVLDDGSVQLVPCEDFSSRRAYRLEVG